ncbi:hypothetical protein JB92DRAFT_321983 [Gautieria morchelliformis]|nr:hypothetical protein JB92DRAFT_321983 [Gautieria morchelliformis]
MPVALSLLAPRVDRPPSDYEDDESSCSSTESNATVRSSRTAPAAHPGITLQRASPTQTTPTAAWGPSDFRLPPSANPSPVPSRSSSPLPVHYASPGASSSSYTSDADSEPTSPLLGRANARRTSWWNDDARRWWLMGSHPGDSRRRRRRLRRETRFGFRGLKRQMRRLIRYPFFPKQPTSIILTLLVFTIVAILITLLLMHILNPDKASLPWRAYCSIPSTSTDPPSLPRAPADEHFTMQVPVDFDPSNPSESLVSNPFPPSYLDDIPPAGVFLGVFTTDSAVERRMLIRSTWASQERSRFGAINADGGNGTSRTIVRFVLGKPRSGWERRVQLESETYNDMIQLPISENMNSGKTHAFFSWVAENAWVPPPAQSHLSQWSPYSNHTVDPPPPAPHDPRSGLSGAKGRWVRPDYVAKADDDSFVMLAELEARLRVELDTALRGAAAEKAPRVYPASQPHTPSEENSRLPSQVLSAQSQSKAWHSLYTSEYASSMFPNTYTDPLIYWGYLVKNHFMAGELYALSWTLVNWVATEPIIKGMTRGAEDKQTAKWLRLHPRASEIRWAAERCWMYDHPRAGTVYSHGFLFPSEATRVRRSILSLLRPLKGLLAPAASTSESAPSSTLAASPSNGNGIRSSDTVTYELPSPLLATTPSYSYSSVSRFGTHYTFPVGNLTPLQSIEALVEGSAMSVLFEGGPETALHAWEKREGRRKRYEGNRVGGTVVVHFIKKNEWFLETALALLGGEEIIEGEEGWTAGTETTQTVGVHEGDGARTKIPAAHQATSRRHR